MVLDTEPTGPSALQVHRGLLHQPTDGVAWVAQSYQQRLKTIRAS